jgi:site-specific recombinase
MLLHSAKPDAPLGTKIAWLEALLAWVRIPTNPEQESRNEDQIQSTRMRFLFMILDRHPDLKLRLSQTVGAVLLETESLLLFSQLGLSREHGFIAEAVDRIIRKWIPTPFNENDLSELFIKIFKNTEDADWIENLDDATTAKVQDLLFSDPALLAQVRDSFAASIKNALIVLTSQIAAIGLSPEIRSRTRVTQIQSSAFFELTKRMASIGESVEGNEAGYLATLGRCREEIRAALSHLEAFGVSIAIVYRLELLEQAIERCEKLAGLVSSQSEGSKAWKGIIADLIRSRFKSVEVKGLVADNLDLLARKIVERTGESGEHYITRNKAEYVDMLLSASGGGILTVGTTAGKFLISNAHAPLFIEGFLSWMNYSGSFLLMQGCGFTLATKQPSMTAPALAMKLKDFNRGGQETDFVTEVTQMTRSQFAAAIGNVGVVIPAAFLFDVIWYAAKGSHVLSPEYAEKVLASLHPFTSMTIPMAALTGFLLWLSSIAAGWVENWFVYRRIPEAITQNQTIKRFAGPNANRKVSAWFSRNISGISGNVALGFFLSFTPVFGRFFGLPLDVRHVTLSTGALTFAVCSLGFSQENSHPIIYACVGIFLIGILNFGVSFVLALYTALRARHIHRRWLIHLAALLWAKLRRQPLAFVLPRDSAL